MNFAARAKLTHPGLEVEHRATLDGVEASDVDGEAIDAIDALCRSSSKSAQASSTTKVS